MGKNGQVKIILASLIGVILFLLLFALCISIFKPDMTKKTKEYNQNERLK